MKSINKFIFCSMVIVSVLAIQGCSKKKNLKSLSPMEIANLYYEAGRKGNVELLGKLIYFQPGTTEQQKQKRIDACNLNSSPEAKAIMGIMGIKMKAKYEKIIDGNTAEVGVVAKIRFSHSRPTEQIILKKEQGVWKYYGYKDNYTSVSELAEAIKMHPDDASLYYYYGMHVISENPYQAHRFFKKYYELEPDGFWITKDLLASLKGFGSVENFEKVMLSGDTLPGNKSDVYTKIGLAFAECMNFTKAAQYYKKAEDALKKYPSPLGKERLEKARKELELRKSGKYEELLAEVEKAQEK